MKSVAWDEAIWITVLFLETQSSLWNEITVIRYQAIQNCLSHPLPLQSCHCLSSAPGKLVGSDFEYWLPKWKKTHCSRQSLELNKKAFHGLSVEDIIWVAGHWWRGQDLGRCSQQILRISKTKACNHTRRWMIATHTQEKNILGWPFGHSGHWCEKGLWVRGIFSCSFLL